MIVAAGDKQEEALGAGILKPGEFYVTCGTASSVSTPVYDRYPQSKEASYVGYGSAIPGTYNAEGGLLRSYWIVSWFIEEFGQAAVEEGKKRGIADADVLNEEAEKIPPGSEGLLVFPFWDAQPWYPQATGLLLGFRGSNHQRAHVTETFDPIPGNVKMYHDFYEKVFLQICPSLKGVFTNLNELTGNIVPATVF